MPVLVNQAPHLHSSPGEHAPLTQLARYLIKLHLFLLQVSGLNTGSSIAYHHRMHLAMSIKVACILLSSSLKGVIALVLAAHLPSLLLPRMYPR